MPSVTTFSPTEHRALAQTGRGTLVGDLLRRYWLPALLSEEIAGPDSDPVRVRLLGEDLVAFRDTAGRAGLLAEHCPHRGASLFLGRNEDGGIRCSYHGWKFDIAGRGLECPNAPELAGTEDARQLAYPCQEAGGIVWAYLGPPEARPPLPDLGYLAAGDDSRYAMKRWQDCH